MCRILSFGLLLLMLSVSAFAQVTPAPPLMNFQGRLTRRDGTPVADGNYSIRFSLWSEAVGGVERWNRTINPVTVRKGVFAVLLDFNGGFTAGNNITTAFNDKAFLEIKVGAEAPLTPRQQVASVAYALRANTVPDGAIGTAQLADGAVTTDKLRVTFPGTLDFLGIGPALNGSIKTLPDPSDVALSGNFAVVLTLLANILHIFDISNPLDIRQTDSIGINAGSRRVAIANNRAYVVNESTDTLQIFNITNPANILFESTTPTGDRPYDVAVVGTTVYVVNFGTGNLQIFNAINPAAPMLQSAIGTTANPTAVAVSGTTAFVTTQGGDDLQTFNVADPNAPSLLRTLNIAADPQDIAVIGNHAYIPCSGANVVDIINVADPAAPVRATSIQTGGNPVRVSPGPANHIYIADDARDSVLEYNITNPASPELAGEVFGGLATTGLAFNNTVLAATDTSGERLYIYRISPGLQINNALTVRDDFGVFGDTVFSGNFTASSNTILNDTVVLAASDVGPSFGSGSFRILDPASNAGIHFDANEIQLIGISPLRINNDNTADTLLNNFARFTTDQRLGLGVSVPAFRLELPNTATDAGGRGRANAWVTYSSGRWKENVVPIENALDKVLRMNGVLFDWLPEYGGTHDIGFVAEDAGKILPELVTWETNGKDATGMKYDRVTALLVEAVKEQQKQIEAKLAKKDAEVDALKAENAALKARLDALSAVVEELKAARK